MQPPNIPDWESMNFAIGDKIEAINKQNAQNAALKSFANDVVDFVKNSAEALLTAGGYIFPTIAEGMAAAEDEGYFYAENEDPDISKTLYQKLSINEWRKVSDDPSNEFVSGVAAAQNAAIEKVSKNSGSIFHTDDKELPAQSLISKDRMTLAAWDRHGNQLIAARKAFHTSDNPFFFGLTDKNRVPLISVDKNLQPIVPLKKAFYTSDDQPAYGDVDKNGVFFRGYDPCGRPMFGGGDISILASSERDAADGSLYLHYDDVKKRRDYSSPFFNQFPLEAIPDLETWYGYYDALMLDNPDYITRVLLDTDSIGNPIYAYEFLPPALRTSISYPIPDSDTPLPSIVIVSGTHGIEKTAAFVALQFAHDLCNSWKNNELARTFRFGVKVVFVPCLVPSGCDANTRKNSNGVDINRNGITEWGLIGSVDPDDDMYVGPSAGSEIETQVGMALPITYPDAFLYIDLHNHTRLDLSTFASWVGARGSRERAILGKVGRDLTGFIRGEFPYLSDDMQVPINQVSDSGGGFIATHWSVAHSAPGIYFESVTSLSSEFGQFRRDALRFNYENFNLTIKAFYEQHLLDIIGSV